MQQAPGWVAQLEAAGVPIGFIAGLAAIGAVVLGLRYLGFLKGGGGDKPDGDGSLREFIGARFDDLGNQIGSVKEDLRELTTDFKKHAEQDRESFRELYARTEPREAWSDDERRTRARASR